MILLITIVFGFIIFFAFITAIIIYSREFETINVIFFVLSIIDIALGLLFVISLFNLFGDDKYLFLVIIGILLVSNVTCTITIGIIAYKKSKNKSNVDNDKINQRNLNSMETK